MSSCLIFQRAAEATSRGDFANEIVPVEVDLGKGKTAIVSEDEEYKNVDFNKVSTLKPAFVKTNGMNVLSLVKEIGI